MVFLRVAASSNKRLDRVCLLILKFEKKTNMENLINAIPNALDALPNQFTTHQIIIILAKENQHAYIEALYEHLDSKRPFQTLHSKIGKFLKESTTLVHFVKDDERDVDIFGQVSENALWEKVA